MEMGFSASHSQEAAEAAACEAPRAVQLLTEGTMGSMAGWRYVSMAAKPVDVSR